MSQSDFAKTGKLQKKIDIFYRDSGGWKYACSTNHWKRCRDAVVHWCNVHNIQNNDGKGNPIVKAYFA